MQATHWRAECVGRVEFELPDDAEMPFTPMSMLQHEANGTRAERMPPEFSFLDGSASDYTHAIYGSVLLLSNELDHGVVQRMLKTHSTDRRSSAMRAFAKRTAPDGKRYLGRLVSLGRPDVSAWQFYGSNFVLAVGFGNHILFTEVDTEVADLDGSRALLREFANSIRPRHLFDVPLDEGVCLPQAFIRDDGKHRRVVSVNYRLKDHPDVTVRVEDVGPAIIPIDKAGPERSPEHRMDFFWMQDYQEPKKYKSLWFGYRKVQIDRRSGLASFMELVRKDDSIDYGYMAVVQGDPSLGRDAPHIRVNVIRDAKEARDKGLEPVSKAEFLDIAQRVTASIKQRPTKKQ
jgi:hypothetical protein